MQTNNGYKDLDFNNLGLGLGLRNVHFPYIMQNDDLLVDWFEIISENFMDNYGYARHVLESIIDKKPIVMHGVSMNIGSSDSLDYSYLAKLKELIEFVNPKWVSDHLCWTGHMGINTHDLLPLPLHEKSLEHFSTKVNQIQEYLKMPFVIENPSTYMEFKESTMSEWEFLSRLVEKTDCKLLLDVNNIFVSSSNHKYDPLEYIQNIPHSSVVQVHLAGPTICKDFMIDTHDHPIPTRVWELYKILIEYTGNVSTMLEWDANIPPYEDVVDEIFKAKKLIKNGTIPQSDIAITCDNAISTPIDFGYIHE
jgi:uncharacterized protein (UPF0276 family)